jgi:hypothetical protein
MNGTNTSMDLAGVSSVGSQQMVVSSGSCQFVCLFNALNLLMARKTMQLCFQGAFSQ